MRPDAKARPEYAEAFRRLVLKIADALSDTPAAVLPIRMFVAGGAAMHFYTGERVSRDIDAVFSHRFALPDALDVSYTDADGAARVLYFDRQYNDTLALMHEDAQQDSVPISFEDVDARILDIRLLSPLDLAVSKISRFSEVDRTDIASLARHHQLSARALQRRATEALAGFIGDLNRVKNSIDFACKIVDDVAQRRKNLK